MSDNDAGKILGCFVLGFIGLMVWIGIRADSFKEFLVIALVTIVTFACIYWSAKLLLVDKNGWGWSVLISTLYLVYVVGTFLFTGDYQRATSLLFGKKATETPAAEVAVAIENTATPKPSATAKPVRTPTPQSQTQETQSDTSHAEFVMPDPVASTISVDEVVGNLNAIWGMSEQEASKMATALKNNSEDASGEVKAASWLLTAVAHERAGETGSAKDLYESIKQDFADTPYAITAAFRMKLLQTEATEKAVDKTYKELWKEAPQDAWFLTPDGWEWTSSRRASALQLIALRSDKLSFRFFQMLHDRSIFETPYAYLFIFLVIVVGEKLLALPLYMRSAKLSVQIRRLSPEIAQLQATYSSDPVTLQTELGNLYKRRGLNIYSGCLVSLVDMIFVIWVFITVQSFAPQMYLDGSKLWWANDVTQFDLKLIGAWIGLAVILAVFEYALRPQQASAAQTIGGVLVIMLIIGAVAWIFKWPAYVFILYGMLSLVGLVMTLILLPIATATTRR